MDKVVIVGVNEYSEYIYYTIKKENKIEVVAFSSLKEYMTCEEFCKLPVFPLEELPMFIDIAECKVLIAIGYTKMNSRRENTYNLCKKLNYNIFTYISTRAICDSDSIGEGTIILPMAYVPPATKIGVCNSVNTCALLGHSSTIGDFNWFSGNCIMGGNVTMGDRCFVGMNTLIKNGVKIESETLIAAFSNMTDNSEEGKFYIGNPAQNYKKIKSSIAIDFV